MDKKISVDTVARTAVLLLALANQFLTVAGKNPLPFAEEDFYGTITGVVTAAASLWAWWKNNSFTQKAISADEYLKELKSENQEAGL